MYFKQTNKQLRRKRLARVRAKIKGTKARPRLCVFKSNYAMSLQLIDDSSNKVILSCRANGKNISQAKELGIKAAKLIADKGVKTVVFDRSGFRYHGAVKALADTIRQGGITI